LTLPLPEPDAPAVTDSQLLFEVAVHEQPLPALTLTVSVVELLSTVAAAGEISYVQAGVAAAWATATVCPAIVRVADRGDVDVFADTV
jgi:hypothetical protein